MGGLEVQLYEYFTAVLDEGEFSFMFWSLYLRKPLNRKSPSSKPNCYVY
jgi:hypothetical protein